LAAMAATVPGASWPAEWPPALPRLADREGVKRD